MTHAQKLLKNLISKQGNGWPIFKIGKLAVLLFTTFRPGSCCPLFWFFSYPIASSTVGSWLCWWSEVTLNSVNKCCDMKSHFYAEGCQFYCGICIMLHDIVRVVSWLVMSVQSLFALVISVVVSLEKVFHCQLLKSSKSHVCILAIRVHSDLQNEQALQRCLFSNETLNYF